MVAGYANALFNTSIVTKQMTPKRTSGIAEPYKHEAEAKCAERNGPAAEAVVAAVLLPLQCSHGGQQ